MTAIVAKGARGWEPASVLIGIGLPGRHQAIGRDLVSLYLARRLDAGDRQPRRIQFSNLGEHARLVPVDSFVGELVALELDRCDRWHFAILAGRFDTGK